MEITENRSITITFHQSDVYAIASEMRAISLASSTALTNLVTEAFGLIISGGSIEISLSEREARLIRAEIVAARATRYDVRFPNIKDLGAHLHRVLGCAP